jgi:short-subunit dehydrogenase
MKHNSTDPRFKEKYGPYALVAGASYGLGGAFAEALARRGLGLVLLARGKEGLESAARRLKEQYNVEVICRAVDLADYEKTKSLVTGLDVPVGLLVYNAAFAPIGLFEDLFEEQLALAAAVNVKAPLLLTKLLTPPMIARGRGGIVLMSSLAGTQGTPKLAAYAATKAFNAVLAEGLWKELKPHGIDVIGCRAGAVLTPGYRRAEKAKAAPGSLEAGEVAERTLRALGKGPLVVPGAVNKLAYFVITRLLSRPGAIALMSKNTGGLS